MDYEAKFPGKASEMSQAWSHTFMNLRRNSEHVYRKKIGFLGF